MHRIFVAVGRMASWLALAACVLPVQAGGLGVNPIRVDLSATAPTAAITLNNGGDTAMVLQLQIAKWTVVAGEDHYEPSDDLLVTPPVFSIAPGTTQIVRVGLGNSPDAQREGAYRLFVEEVPPPAKPGYQGLRVALRVGVPVFVAPAQAAQATLQWSARRSGADRVVVQVGNLGQAHGRVLGLSLRELGHDRVLVTDTAARYILPGQTRAWTLRLDSAWAGDKVHLTATTDQGAADADLDLQHP